jgi:hypothetical protein
MESENVSGLFGQLRTIEERNIIGIFHHYELLAARGHITVK